MPSGRARPLPPDERRAALVEATLPLVARFGTKVTTRQIAEAASVAEGTIFRVFPDKDALIREAMKAALDTAPVLDDLASITADLPLRDRMHMITRILQGRLVLVFGVMIATRTHAPEPTSEQLQGRREKLHHEHKAIYVAVERLLEPDADRFRVPLPEVARLLRLLVFSGTHPLITEHDPLSAEQIVSVLLDGVLKGNPC